MEWWKCIIRHAALGIYTYRRLYHERRTASGHRRVLRCVRYDRHLIVESVSTIQAKIQLAGRFDLGIRGVCGLDCQSNTSNNNHTAGEDHESFEIIAQHALGFIVIASTSLLVLFFFKIYNVPGRLCRLSSIRYCIIHSSDASGTECSVLRIG